MSEREASVKLTLDDGQYLVELRKCGDAAEKAGKKGQKGMSVFGHGVKQATEDLKGLRGTAEKALGLVTGLAAGFSVGSALKGAVELDHKFKQIAFRVGIANGELVKSADIQRLVERAAAKTGQRTADLADAYDDLFKATGDSGFAGDVIEAIGTSSMATGAELGTLTQLADQLHTKFGVAAGDMQEVFAQVIDAAQRGGPSLEEFSDVAATMGAELLNAGFEGKRGLDFMLGSLVETDDKFGNLNKQVKGIKQILLSLGDPAQIKALAKSLNINPNVLLKEKDMMARMRKVLAMGQKGLDALKGSMLEGEEQKALKILFTDPFEAALAEANASGLKGKAAIDKALGVLDAGIADFGKSATTGATIQAEAADRMKDPSTRLTLALETLERSFASPEIIEAIEELSTYLPDIARVFGGFAKFAAQNPLLAGAMGLGARAGLGFIQGAAVELIKGHVAGASAAAVKIQAAHVAGSMKLGNVMQGAAGLFAIAIAGALAKEQIDKALGANEDAQKSSAVATAQAGSTRGNLKTKRKQADTLRAAIAKEKDAQSGASGFTQDLLGGVASLVDADAPNMRAQSDARIQELQAMLQKKEREIATMAGGSTTSPADAGKGGAKPAAPVDPRVAAKAAADALKSGPAMRVEVINQPAAGSSRAGPGGSRGPARPAAAAPAGGV